MLKYILLVAIFKRCFELGTQIDGGDQWEAAVIGCVEEPTR